MNAINFIKQHGVDKARKVIDGAPEWAIFWITQGEYHISMLSFPSMAGHHSFLISDLKRLVESVDLVKRYGGIAEAKTIHNDEFWCERAFEQLEQAIADYESIYGGEHV